MKGCLDSLASEVRAGADENGMEIRAFVGDAQSGDGSVESIGAHIAARGYGTWALCYDIGRNGGFAYGNNAIVAEHVAPDPSFTHVHFLNPDTYIRPGAVRALAGFLSAHPRAGALELLAHPGAGHVELAAVFRDGSARDVVPALFELLEEEGWDYAIRIKGNSKLHERVDWLTKRAPDARRSTSCATTPASITVRRAGRSRAG